MPIEQMNISLPPKMARFIRGKVKAGQYTNASEVVRDAVRHMQEAEAAKRWPQGDNLEARLTPRQREGIRKQVQAGIAAMDRGDYTEYDADGLRAMAQGMVKRSARKLASHKNGKE